MMEDVKDALQTAIARANHAQLSIICKSLQKECERLKANLESKTEIANQLKDRMADMFEKSVALQAERDALAARCLALESAGELMASDLVNSTEFFSLQSIAAFNAAKELPPQHHLAAHDAEVAKAAYMAAVNDWGNDPYNWLDDEKNPDTCCEQYAAQLRAKAGE